MNYSHGDLLLNSAIALIEECDKRGINTIKGYTFYEESDKPESIFLAPGESMDLIEGDIYFHIYNINIDCLYYAFVRF